ncbi:MAG: prepilin peptidase [Rhodospirillales bacterium]|nr:prepilin peptidase [Rhodospirillales bacterium]MDE2197817.1 prepilin peptidase [Rhodospirillales bacterium]MDE2575902.1 prepilin peptidase [Rhodospirillales bacterium]
MTAHRLLAADPLLVLQIVALVGGAVILVAAALHDVAARTIPNWAPAGLALFGLVLRFESGELLTGLAVGLAVFLVATFCWTRGWMGGGDVKLLAGTAIFMPPAHVTDTLLAITLAGGVVGLIYMAWRAVLRRRGMVPGPRPHQLLARVLRAERWRLLRGCPLPYASAIAVGTLFMLASR